MFTLRDMFQGQNHIMFTLRGHVAGTKSYNVHTERTCSKDMFQGQNHVMLTLRGHVAGTCS